MTRGTLGRPTEPMDTNQCREGHPDGLSPQKGTMAANKVTLLGQPAAHTHSLEENAVGTEPGDALEAVDRRRERTGPAVLGAR